MLGIRVAVRGRYHHANGFPRGYLSRRKTWFGFRTGDLVQADVLQARHPGVHIGTVAIRRSGSFRMGAADGIPWRHCRPLFRAGGYSFRIEKGGSGASSPGMNARASGAA